MNWNCNLSVGCQFLQRLLIELISLHGASHRYMYTHVKELSDRIKSKSSKLAPLYENIAKLGKKKE